MVNYIVKYLYFNKVLNQILLQFLSYNNYSMATITLILILLPVVIILYVFYMFFVKIYIDAARFRKMDPNLKTFIAPFSGIQGVQKFNIEKYGDSHRFAKQLVKQNPDQNAYLTNVGYKPMLVVCSAKLIKEISTNAKDFRKFNLYKHSDKSYLKGIFLVEGEDWSSQKSIIRHSFNHDSLKKMIPIMNDSINNFLNRIKQQVSKSQTKTREFNVVHENQLMIGEILVRIFFSEQALNKYVHGKKLSLALADFTTDMFNRSRSGQNIIMELFFKSNVIKMNFTEGDRQLEKLINDIRVILHEIIEQRLKNYSQSPQNQGDFIHEYLTNMKDIDQKIAQAQKQGIPHKYRKITKQQIVHQLVSFYFAGIDTTGHLIAMALYSIAEFPQCRQKLIAQLQQVIKSPSDLTYENLQKLQYMGKFLDQCLRMWPPAVGILLREAKRDMTLGPYQISKGMLIGTNIVGLMHNTKYYTNPEVFDPERWNDKTLYNSQPYSFIPFSAGQRSCIGKYLALMESKLMIIGFLTNFKIERTQVPLRLHAKFLYEPIEENLVKLSEGGIRLGK